MERFTAATSNGMTPSIQLSKPSDANVALCIHIVQTNAIEQIAQRREAVEKMQKKAQNQKKCSSDSHTSASSQNGQPQQFHMNCHQKKNHMLLAHPLNASPLGRTPISGAGHVSLVTAQGWATIGLCASAVFCGPLKSSHPAFVWPATQSSCQREGQPKRLMMPC